MIRYIKLDIFLKDKKIPVLPFIGSTIRGAFGVNLKKVVCINPSYNCDKCFAKDNCLYYDFYEEKNKAHQYRFDFELNQNSYNFSLYLFEDATTKLPYVLSAIHKMLTQTGLTKNREIFEIEKILCNQQEIYKDGNFDIKEIESTSFTPRDIKSPITVNFMTPLRMKYQNKLLTEKPPLEILLYSIQNRLHQLKDLPQIKLTFTPEYKETKSSINFKDQTRRSNRQKTKLQIGGIVGYIEYKKINENSLLLLQLGEIIGVGKQCVFGMGKINVKEISNEL